MDHNSNTDNYSNQGVSDILSKTYHDYDNHNNISNIGNNTTYNKTKQHSYIWVDTSS